jgi:hypothetical protein
MKTTAFVIFLNILAVPLFAQDFQPLPAPPNVVGVPFYLDIAAGQLKKLATEPYKRNDPLPGLISMKQSVEIKGAASAFRVPSQNKIVFVYDAATLPELYKFDVHGNRRKFEYGKVNASHSTKIEGVSITVQRYRETAFQFQAEQPLTSGEYAIVFGDHIYTFGVD